MAHVAPMRMIFEMHGKRTYVVSMHVGEAGITTTSQRLLCVLADELELILPPTLRHSSTSPAAALRSALAWRGSDAE